jgi:hypothetical protein
VNAAKLGKQKQLRTLGIITFLDVLSHYLPCISIRNVNNVKYWDGSKEKAVGFEGRRVLRGGEF